MLKNALIFYYLLAITLYKLVEYLSQEVNLAYENVKEVDILDVSKEGADAWEAAVKRYFRILVIK